MFLDQIKINDPILLTSVPTWKIKGDKKVKIEIDDVSTLYKGIDAKRINITCFDFQLQETLHRYRDRNPKIIKQW